MKKIIGKIKVKIMKVKTLFKRKKSEILIGKILASQILKMRDEAEDELIVAERTNGEIEAAKAKIEILDKIINLKDE